MFLSARHTLIGTAIALSALISGTTHADATGLNSGATGLWKGYATWAFEGSSVPCILNIRFEENSSELRRHKGQLECHLVAMHSDPLLWQKEGSELTLEGEAAGKWSDQGFETHESPEDNVKVVSTLNTTTGEYQEIWSRISDGAQIYDIRAKLQRSK